MKLPILDEHTAAHVAELFRAFSDTSRVRILSAIIDKELNISTLAEMVGLTEFGSLSSYPRFAPDAPGAGAPGWQRSSLLRDRSAHR